MTLSIQQIKEKFQQAKDIDIDELFIEQLREDGRKGVQALLKKYDREQENKQMLEQMHKQMSMYEEGLRENGYTHIAGIDEVGRGPLAGPVVAAAVILPTSFKLLGLTDSKKLSKAKREEFARIIKKEAIAYSIQMVSASLIDELNIYQATKRAMTEAVQTLNVKPDYLLIDAMKLSVSTPQMSLIKGDQKSLSIAASSILAKVARDKYMEKVDETYPGYGFSEHVGYGTKNHLEALERFELTPEHRRSFRPIKK